MPSNVKFFKLEFIQSLEQAGEIGSGGNGRVVKVFEKVLYALKIMNSGSDFEKFKRFFNEYELLNNMNHPSILHAFGIFMGDEKNPPSILLEYCPLDMSKAIKNNSLSNVQIVLYIYQTAEGMKYTHANKIIHRDLKPSNILIAYDGNIRICDFGVSKLVADEDTSMTGGLGTQKFMAPEIINEESYNEKVDVYAFGVIVYFILSKGKMPKITVTHVGSGKKAEIPSSFTQYARELIDKCWNFDPNDRPNFNQICDEMERNNFDLLDLTNSEMLEVQQQINKYKALVPPY